MSEELRKDENIKESNVEKLECEAVESTEEDVKDKTKSLETQLKLALLKIHTLVGTKVDMQNSKGNLYSLRIG
jgi:hypothetical protein